MDWKSSSSSALTGDAVENVSKASGMRVRLLGACLVPVPAALRTSFPLRLCDPPQHRAALFQRLDREPQAVLDLLFLRDVEVAHVVRVPDSASVARFAFVGVDLAKST